MKEKLAAIPGHVRSHARYYSLGLTGLIALTFFGGVVYMQSSPEYSVYKLHQAVKNNDEATFKTYWKAKAPVLPAPAPAEATGAEAGLDGDSGEPLDEKDQTLSLEEYKQKYYYDMSIKGAFSTTEVIKEKISDGVVVFMQGKQPETAMRLVREQGHWVVTEFAPLQ